MVPQGDDDRQCLNPLSIKRLIVPGLIAIFGVALIPLAEITFNPVKHTLAWLPIAPFFSTCNQLGGRAAMIGIILIIWCLDHRQRHLVVYYLVALIIAGSIVGAIKQTAGRIRPQDAVGLSKKDAAMIAQEYKLSPEVASKLRTDRWNWLSKKGTMFTDAHASFPSGHACSVFAAAAFLCLLYPPARWVWIGAAMLAALARVKFERHYPEDIMVGGAIAWGVSLWVYSWCWPMQVGRGAERKIAGWLNRRRKTV